MGPKPRDVLERFSEKYVIASTGCWEWSAGKDSKGYGQFVHHGSRSVPAQRVAYELFVGPIPAGLTIDHLCRNPGCVNPDHLEAVTRSENVRRQHAARTHCKRGHPLSGANLYIPPRRPHERQCRECQRARSRTWEERNAA